jgi:hypothetical protein
VQVRLAGAKPSDKELFKLGAVLPFSPIRKQFQAMVDRTWEKGPADFVAAGAFKDAMRDPGLLLVLKTVPWRNRIHARTAGGFQGGGGAGGFQGGGAAGGAAKGNKEGGAKAKAGGVKNAANAKAEAAEQWLDATEDYVRALYARFRAAAKSTGDGDPPPIKLSNDGDVVAEYHLKLPNDLPTAGQQLSVPPTTVHYYRLEAKDRFVNIARHYSAQVPDRNKHVIDNGNGEWFENRVAREGVAKSYDVMVTRAKSSGGGGFAGGQPGGAQGGKKGPPQAEQLVVEILYVEIADYSK